MKQQKIKNDQAMALLTKQELKQLLKKYPELLKFAKDFYNLLAIKSPGRKTNDRKLDNRRLDAFARLLVGDEICVAVSFDNNHLLIATNRNQHVSDYMKFRANLIIKAGTSYRNGYLLQNAFYFSFNGQPFFQQLSEPYHAHYHEPTNSLVVDDKKNSIITVSPFNHKIPYLPEISIQTHLQNISFNDANLPPLPKDFRIDQDIEVNTPFVGEQYIDPLKRRADLLIKHLALIYLVAKNEDKNLIEKANKIIEENRHKFLTQSLLWHAAVLYEKSQDLRAYKQTEYAQQTEAFIQTLAKDFQAFKANIAKGNFNLILLREWRLSFLQKIVTGKIVTPEFIKKKPEIFVDRAKHYLMDLIKLEDYIVQITKNTNSETNIELLKILSKENPWQLTSSIEVLDDQEKDLHAEMRIIQKFRESKLPIPYIAISKLCCPFCNLVMQQLGITNISGYHGRIPNSWRLSAYFKKDKEFLSQWLGKELFNQYNEFEKQKKEINFRKGFFLKDDLALLIIESLGELGDKDLKELGIADKKIWDTVSEFADESDEDAQSEKEISNEQMTAVQREKIDNFMAAVNDGDIESIQKFLQEGIDVNIKDNGMTKATALHWAATTENEELIQILLNAGADPNITDSNGDTAIKWAEENETNTLSELLKKRSSFTTMTLSNSSSNSNSVASLLSSSLPSALSRSSEASSEEQERLNSTLVLSPSLKKNT